MTSCATVPPQRTTITLLHVSDYHSHALPFYSEGLPSQGGIARAIGYLRQEKGRGALVFNGGDMMNKGAPAWSDRYRCAEWPWLNGIVDAMAFGNHDPDYGFEEFVECRQHVQYPILSANTEGFQPHVLLENRGLRIGVFAVAGSDFPALVRIPELKYSDPLVAARETVKRLREVERADVVVMIGHEHAEDDFKMARAVPGIDLIFGSHTHLKQDLIRIDGTSTWFISPYQYLTYLSRVELTFKGRRLADVKGRLIPVDATLPLDRAIESRVGAMQAELAEDPQYRELFTPVATLRAALTVDELGSLSVETMRDVTGADLALSTTSSFRQPLPPGVIDMETLRAAMPYDNEIVLIELTREQAERMRQTAASKGDGAAFLSGAIPPGEGTVRVATTDYAARVAAPYREVFAGAPVTPTGKRVRDEVRKRLGR